jgi:uncharacterized membrane protein (UPF0136 family)
VVLLLYALFMIAGGVMGYRKAGSKVSLVAGAGSGVALLVAFLLVPSTPVGGYWVGALTSLLLCVVFAARVARTGKFMPAGGLLVVSIAALIVLTRYALLAQGKL